MPNHPTPVELSDAEVSEVAEMFPHAEYQPDVEAMPLCAFCGGAIDDHEANCVVPHVHALCATVRALRAKVALCEGEITAADPGKWGHESRIGLLRSRLAQVEQERDDLLNRSHQTVLFDCGCMFKQEGLDAEPMLVVHCAGKEQP